LVWWIVLAGFAWLGFAYAGYPLLLAALRAVSPRPITRGDVTLSLSVIIAAHNGAAELRRKLESVLDQDYTGPVEVIVSSDGSTDTTVEVARSFESAGVQVIDAPQRAGKEAAQGRGIALAKGEVLVMTDVAGELAPDALRQIVRPFADPSVGCVSSEDEVSDAGGEGAYVRYEMALRRLESETTSLVGASGSFFAFRRELAADWRDDLASDFRIALEAVRRGLRAVCEPAARARFTATNDVAAEWHRKVRTIRRGLAVLSAYRDVLHPRHGRAAFSLWGHKVGRFGSPFALLAIAAGSAAGAAWDPFLAGLLGLQALAYAVAGAGLARPGLTALLPVRIASFFFLVNAATLVAWRHHLGGERVVVWQPTRR
jgi:cellulose synthase/poly-beta-1,6-N-acetylglucosamine synthase-like glycosyltransferase